MVYLSEFSRVGHREFAVLNGTGEAKISGWLDMNKDLAMLAP